MNLKILLKQFSISTVYVTHDHLEALILADRLAIMDRGCIEQVGTHAEIYERPKNVFVAGFSNRHIGTPPISFVNASHVTQGHRLGDVQIGVRPEDVEVSRESSPDSIRASIAGRLTFP